MATGQPNPESTEEPRPESATCCFRWIWANWGGADAVPEPRVVGDFGETPGFVYRQHLESVIGQGAPPTSLLRRILLG
jgi:hypothetical protein